MDKKIEEAIEILMELAGYFYCVKCEEWVKGGVESHEAFIH